MTKKARTHIQAWTWTSPLTNCIPFYRHTCIKSQTAIVNVGAVAAVVLANMMLWVTTEFSALLPVNMLNFPTFLRFLLFLFFGSHFLSCSFAFVTIYIDAEPILISSKTQRCHFSCIMSRHLKLLTWTINFHFKTTITAQRMNKNEKQTNEFT